MTLQLSVDIIIVTEVSNSSWQHMNMDMRNALTSQLSVYCQLLQCCPISNVQLTLNADSGAADSVILLDKLVNSLNKLKHIRRLLGTQI